MEEQMRRRGILTQNNQKYRSRTDIIHDILQCARSTGNGARKTHLMFSAFLSSAQFKEYLTTLIDSDLLQYDSSNQKFRTTEKGFRYLKLCEQINDLIDEEEESQQQQR